MATNNPTPAPEADVEGLIAEAEQAARNLGVTYPENTLYMRLAARIAELERERDTQAKLYRQALRRAEAAERETARLRERLSEADRVIEPFTRHYDLNDLHERAVTDALEIPVSALRAARHYRQSEGE